MEAELKQEFGAEVTLLKGGAGIFDVHVDGTLVFSKHEVGRHADPGEVLRAIREKGLA
ncbi:MAG TPA: hypothetical protein DCE42_13660 [Myxococcales bacterium]|nr:hypothetical protein [Deltaproteobacteria bacterium]MBU54289.1 hypothetical protein [Deltaproteobacteria bacterium]HAA55803.1 hypothetical protein [Myxococcales bacterium]